MKRTMTKDIKTAVAEEALQLVTFHVGTEEYGLDIKTVTEVIRPLKITPLPRMPQFIEGVINLRGVIVPVVDLRKRFFLGMLAGKQKTVRIMIIRGAVPMKPENSQDLLGLVVDAVNEVLTLPLRDIEPAPAAAIDQNAELIHGMGKVGTRLIILLDITKILSREERSALVEAEKTAE